MLQVNYIRENKAQIVTGLNLRNYTDYSILDEVIALDNNRKQLQYQLDSLLSELNIASKKIGELYQTGQYAVADTQKADAAKLREESKIIDNQLNEVKDNLNKKLLLIPNVPNTLVKPGTTDQDNEIIFCSDNIKELPESALAHWNLIKQYNLIDFELGIKITGAGFPVYTGKGARLQRGLINFFLEKNIEAGYYEYFLPYLVNESSGLGTGQLPDKDGQMYYSERDDLYIIPTGEVPMLNVFREVVLNHDVLPIKATTHTPCFRREAGSWGAHVRGLNRLHQFEKVEIIQITRIEDSYKALDEMLNHVESLLKALELPYRIVRLCGGDLGFTSALTYDFEVYSSAQKRWLEVSSVSNCLDFQTYRLKLRYKDSDGKLQFCHALNGSSLALPRIMAALLENNQTADGITIPEVIKPYVNFDRID